MRQKVVRAKRAGRYLLVPERRFVEPEDINTEPASSLPEVITFLVEKIKVHREEIADAQNYLDQLLHYYPKFTYLVPKQSPSLVVSNQRRTA